MREINWANISKDGFALTAVQSGTELSVKMTGTGNLAATPTLNGFLLRLEGEIQSHTRVSFDIRSLAFLNSSCLKTFVTLIHKILLAKSSCGVVFVVDPDVLWQRRCLSPLARLAPETVTIEES